MKKASVFSSIVFLFIVVFSMVPDPAVAQDGSIGKDKSAIPGNLNAVFQNSCMPCHWQGGKIKSTFHVNFSNWDNYSPEKQAEKAKKICSVLLADDMPPASARENKPDIVPSKDQMDAICKWAETLQVESEPIPASPPLVQDKIM
ncbi:MAG: heme-binding domain-containing protein [Bacteroidales bacterium]